MWSIIMNSKKKVLLQETYPVGGGGGGGGRVTQSRLLRQSEMSDNRSLRSFLRGGITPVCGTMSILGGTSVLAAGGTPAVGYPSYPARTWDTPQKGHRTRDWRTLPSPSPTHTQRKAWDHYSRSSHFDVKAWIILTTSTPKSQVEACKGGNKLILLQSGNCMTEITTQPI